jgi:hypothetical protein
MPMNRKLAPDFNKSYGSFFKEGIDAYLGIVKIGKTLR